MYPGNRTNVNDDNKSRRIKMITSAIPITGIIIFSAWLLSGLISLVDTSYYQIAAAQQNITEGNNATTTDATTPGGNGSLSSSACASTQTTAGGGNTTTGINATTTREGANHSTISELRMQIQQACVAAQNNDTQGVLMNLTLALNALVGGDSTQGNVTVARYYSKWE